MTKPALTLVPMLAVALAMPVAQAARTKLPAKFMGRWCVVSGTHTYLRGRCPEDDGAITVHPTGYDGWEHSCTLLSASPTADKETYNASFKCGGEGMTWTQKNTRMSLRGGRLTFTAGRILDEAIER